MKTRHITLIALSLILVSTTAFARPRGYQRTNRTNRTNTTVRPQNHGDRAYNDALSFARTNNLPHFTVRNAGVKRVVVNVTSAKMQAWCNTFSKGKCYIEPHFNASKTSAPGWSMLRVGEKNWRQYGTGETYRANTYGGRVAFPISLSQQELDSTMHKIKTSNNAPFVYNGGNPETTGRNCTNWVTYKIGQFTGVTTGSVKHHMSALVNGRHSNRSTVMAVMTNEKVQNFGQDQLNLQWH